MYLIVHNPKMGNNGIANMLVNTARPTCNPCPLVFSPLSSRNKCGYVLLTLLLSGNLYLLCTAITKLYHNAMFPPSATDWRQIQYAQDGAWMVAWQEEWKCILKMGVRKAKPSRNHSCRCQCAVTMSSFNHLNDLLGIRACSENHNMVYSIQ